MANVKYTYLITDFPNNKADAGNLYVTILESQDFTCMVDSINVDVDDVDVWFRAALSPAEWATLSGIVAVHDGEEYAEEKPAIDQSMYGKNISGSWVPMRFTDGGRLMVEVQTTAADHGNELHTSEFITVSGVTYEALDANEDVGTGADQIAQGDHLHDDRYYTETEIDNFSFLTTVSGGAHDELFNLDYASSGHIGFSPTVHTHTEADITDLQDYVTEVEFTTYSGTLQDQIDGKADIVHTHVEADITDLDHDAVKIQGIGVSTTDPTAGQALVYNGSEYIPDTVSGTGGSLWTDAGSYIYRDGSVVVGDTTWSGTARLYIRGYTLPDETHWIRAEGIEAGQGINDGGLFVVKYREDEAPVLLLGDHNNNPLIQLQQTGTGGTEDNPDHYIKLGMVENLSSDFYIGIDGTERLRVETDGTLSVAGTTDYETLVIADDDIPNKKYLDDEIAAIPGGGVFGSEYNAETSEWESSTTSTSWQSKIDFDIDVPAGTYILHWYAEVRMNSTSYSVLARVEIDASSSPPYIGFTEIEPQDTDNWYVFSGHKVLSLDGTHDIDLEYCRKGSGGTAYIRKGRFTLWRIS